MTLSIALGDLRMLAPYVTREEQPVHERIYFVRVFASHLREVVKLIDRDAESEDIKHFTDALPDAAHEARRSIREALDQRLRDHDEATLLDDLKRLRNDTFHYAGESSSKARLQEAMRRASPEEGIYLLEDKAMRAEYADLVVAHREFPLGDGSQAARNQALRELHDAIIGLNGSVAKFIQQAEAAYLLEHLPQGVVRIEK